MIEIVTKIITIFAMIAVGLIAVKAKVIPVKASGVLIDILICITTPALIIASMAGKELDGSTMRMTIEVLVFGAAGVAVAALIAYIFVKVIRYKPEIDRGVIMALMTSMNSGFMGFPVSKAVFGNDIFYLFVIQNIVLNVYLFSFAIMQMNYGTGTRLRPREILRSFVNMPIIATVIGCVILFGQIKLPGPVLSFCSTLGDMTIPLSMLLVGVLLAQSRISEIFRNYKMVIACIVSITITPLCVFLVVNWLPISPMTKLTIVFAQSFPCAVVTSMVAAKEGKNAKLAAEGIAVSTILSLVTLPCAAVLLAHLYAI